MDEKIIKDWIKYIEQNIKHIEEVEATCDDKGRPQTIFIFKKSKIKLGKLRNRFV